jgi:pimeloyl-ACP methyl ester carboxylesterase
MPGVRRGSARADLLPLTIGTLRREGISFSYLDRGAGAPLVFQHGLGGDASQPDGLYARERRLVCLECRGHGGTAPLGDPDRLGFATFAADVLALMDELEIERALVGGVSMGAGVAARLAADHPNRVAGLVLVRPAWVDAAYPDSLRIMETVAELLQQRSDLASGLTALERDPAYLAIAAAAPSAAASLRNQFARRLARERAVVLQRMVADSPLSGGPQWAEIATPTLILAAHGDPIHPFAVAEAIAARLPSVELREIPSKDADAAGHSREIAAALAAFAEERWNRRD